MDFRKKLLTLSVSAMTFAGVSYGQICGAPAVAPNAILANLLRLEGTNELASDVTITCPASTLASASIIATLNATVTSKQVSSSLNEATLLITTGGVATQYPGVVTGTQVVFGGSAGVTLPTAAGYTMRFANIRVNASTAAVNTYVTESILATNGGVVEYSAGGVQVGYVQQGFAAPSLVALSVNNYPICTTTQTAKAPGNTSFQIKLSELFGGAFKTQTGSPQFGTNGEQGSYNATTAGAVPPAGVGIANSGTRFLYSFSNIPSGVTLYVPTTLTNGPLTLTLTASATGPLSPVAASIPTGSSLPAGDVALTAANGAATAVYEVTATDNTVPTETVTLTGIVTFSAGFASTAQPAITVIVTPAPTGSTNVPNFATSANTALTLSAFPVCQTNLLFPYVTNTFGFDVGIVLANTSTDPFATGSTATPTPGSCVLNFYGSGAPTPSTAVAAPPGTATAPFAQTSGSTNGFLLSQVAPGFTGYMIAQCNYQYGHGFAYIISNFAQNSGTAMGYLAEVLTGRPIGSAPAAQDGDDVTSAEEVIGDGQPWR